jgi:hypothetical protein
MNLILDEHVNNVFFEDIFESNNCGDWLRVLSKIRSKEMFSFLLQNPHQYYFQLESTIDVVSSKKDNEKKDRWDQIKSNIYISHNLGQEKTKWLWELLD